MTDNQIIEYFDSHLNVTLAELAKLTGRTVPQLKKLLLGTQ